MCLVDKNVQSPSQIDMLIGTDRYYDLIDDCLIRLGRNLPTLLSTQLGWVIAGHSPIVTNQKYYLTHSHISTKFSHTPNILSLTATTNGSTSCLNKIPICSLQTE